MKLFKKRVQSTRSLEELEKENTQLKAKISGFRILLHWRGVACWRALEIIKKYDEHFDLPPSKDYIGI